MPLLRPNNLKPAEVKNWWRNRRIEKERAARGTITKNGLLWIERGVKAKFTGVDHQVPGGIYHRKRKVAKHQSAKTGIQHDQQPKFGKHRWKLQNHPTLEWKVQKNQVGKPQLSGVSWADRLHPDGSRGVPDGLRLEVQIRTSVLSWSPTWRCHWREGHRDYSEGKLE